MTWCLSLLCFRYVLRGVCSSVVGLICNVPGDVVFVLDGSDSIKPQDWVRQRNFVANLINNLEVGPAYIHVSVVVFSSTIGEVITLMPFKPKQLLAAQVMNLEQPRFGTDTALGKYGQI